jgi:hypothetical protein
VFLGRVETLNPADTRCALAATSWDLLLDECETLVDFVPTMVVVREDWDGVDPADETDFREVVALAALGGYIFGFEHEAGTTDPAFGEAGQLLTPQVLIRRPWAPSAVRLWSYDPSTTPPETFADKKPVSSTHWSVDWHAGAMTIAEKVLGSDDATPKVYVLTNVRCYLESAATGATDVDAATVLAAALQYPSTGGDPTPGGIGAASGDLDFPGGGIGLDLASALFFQGRVSDLLRDLQKQLAPHLRLWHEPRTGKWTVALTDQKAAEAEDLELIHPRAISVNRAGRDLYSRVVATGKKEYPANAILDCGVTLGDDLGAGAVFGTYQDLTFQDATTWLIASQYLWDGDGNTGTFVRNLDGDHDYRYSHFYTLCVIGPFVDADGYAETRNVEYVGVILPMTQNINAQQGHQGGFWPGLRLLGSTDGTNWQLLTPQIDGRYKPLSQIEVKQEQLLVPRARYIKVLCGAYKHRKGDGDDPAIALGELTLITSLNYRQIREIDGNVSPLTTYSYTRDLDGDGVLDIWQRNHPDLWTRLGRRHRTKIIELGSQYPEAVAGDLALSYLDEGVRLFEGLSFATVCDPRVRLYQTAKVVDAWNSYTGSILVERLTLTDKGSTIEGTNYLAAGLSNE